MALVQTAKRMAHSTHKMTASHYIESIEEMGLSHHVLGKTIMECYEHIEECPTSMLVETPKSYYGMVPNPEGI